MLNKLFAPRVSPKVVFVSYARLDGELVRPIVSLLRHALEDRRSVFLDTDSIDPGADWRHAIAGAIEKSDLFYIFWSEAAKNSIEVSRELQMAIDAAIPIVPIRLDDAILPDNIARINAVSFNYDHYVSRRTSGQKGFSWLGLDRVIAMEFLALLLSPSLGIDRDTLNRQLLEAGNLKSDAIGHWAKFKPKPLIGETIKSFTNSPQASTIAKFFVATMLGAAATLIANAVFWS